VIHRLQTRWPEARVVHRLDMATSGLMVFALDAASHVALNRQFAERQVAKRYTAVVAGLVAQDAGEIDLPLICDWPNRPRQMVDAERGKPSLTHYQVLARDTLAGTTRVALTPVTGRSHQLRVHLLALGHPIVGDALYAAPPWDTAATRLLLHADQLQFTQPHTGQALIFEAAAPF
jgi:tRNA pseudouridine32 synthase/23S rRNA pseudouridine746 synthase